MAAYGCRLSISLISPGSVRCQHCSAPSTPPGVAPVNLNNGRAALSPNMDDTCPAPEIDQELAQRLFKEGAMCVMLEVPEGTEVGIDYNSWRAGSRFHGVKMIPPGVHFVYYGATGKDDQVAPRTGFFHHFKQREVIVRKWDKQHEDLVCASAEELERVEENKKELDRYLGVYPYKSYKKWISLTNHITTELITHLQPASGRICSVMQVQSEPSTTESRRQAAALSDSDVDKDGLPAIHPVPGSEIRFSSFDVRQYPVGATPQEITKYSMDSSFCLERLLDTTYKNDEAGILGEIQFAFICFLTGQVYDGFEQWKKLVALLCSCDDALSKRPHLYEQFITVLHYHLAEVPEDFFVDIVSRDNFLTTNLQVFFANVGDSDAPESLRSKARRFQNHLTKKFKWDFTSEPDDCAPVVVEEAN